MTPSGIPSALLPSAFPRLRRRDVPSATVLLLALLSGALAVPSLRAQTVESPARAAVSAARALQDRGSSPPEIAAAMQTPGQTAAILRGLRHNATRAGDAVRRAYRTDGQGTVRSLLSGGFPHADAVRGGVGNRVATADIVRAFSAVRVPTDATTRALADASVPVDRTVGAFRDLQIPVQSSAPAVVGAYPDIRGRVVDTYQRVGYGAPSLLQVIGVLEFSPETVVEEMRGRP